MSSIRTPTPVAWPKLVELVEAASARVLGARYIESDDEFRVFVLETTKLDHPLDLPPGEMHRLLRDTSVRVSGPHGPTVFSLYEVDLGPARSRAAGES